MVQPGIPKNCTTSPSTVYEASSLTINSEVTLDLDSSNAFEGPEKLLEVWFSPAAQALDNCSHERGLKAVSSETWKSMLDLVNCKVLSVVESDEVDAYLLSESSMFVFPHKLILKTCGTTTLLSGLPRILEIAALCGGFMRAAGAVGRDALVSAAAAPYRVFYSRKNFLFPERQHGPHRSWRDEVRSLDRLFWRGSAYMIGKMNGEHWYLYLTEPHTMLTPPASPAGPATPSDTETKLLHLPSSALKPGRSCAEEDDETLEILMTDLDEERAKQFYVEHASAVAESQQAGIAARADDDLVDIFNNRAPDPVDGMVVRDDEAVEGHALGTVVSDACGLSAIYPRSKYPQARIDAYLFAPCGFSANAVIPAPPGKPGTHYFTVHVTPEPNCSYASFETNVPPRADGRDAAETVGHVVDIFQPGRFSVTLFEAKTTAVEKAGMSADADALHELKARERKELRRSAKMDAIEGYRRVDRIVHDLDGYDLVFRYYERHDWAGGLPCIGERGC